MSTEAKLIKRIRKQQHFWPKMRWLVVLGAISGLYVSWAAWHLFDILLSDQKDYMDATVLGIQGGSIENTKSGIQMLKYATQNIKQDTLIMATYLVFSVVSGLFGFFSICVLLRDWHGNANQILLLKVIDAEKDRENKSAQSPKPA